MWFADEWAPPMIVLRRLWDADGCGLVIVFMDRGSDGYGPMAAMELGGQPWSTSRSVDRRSRGPIWLICILQNAHSLSSDPISLFFSVLLSLSQTLSPAKPVRPATTPTSDKPPVAPLPTEFDPVLQLRKSPFKTQIEEIKTIHLRLLSCFWWVELCWIKHYIRIKRRESILIFLSLPKQKGKKKKKNLSLIVEEEEVETEVEAVQAVYGDDCVVLQSYPPHLHLLLKPRTADVTSQQR
uniref:Uncharacterized protein n=1 Tax=Quercus lobata TaxID=97700 RepID=A0A7N2R3X3_QUELO